MDDLNYRQIGGTHYHSKYPHWDLVVDTGMGYFEAQITRYVVRHRKPDGGEGEKDLLKALHYLDKFISVRNKCMVSMGVEYVRPYVERFAEQNALTGLEFRILLTVAGWDSGSDLGRAKAMLIQLLAQFRDGLKPVPLTEENHHAEREDKAESSQQR